MNKHHTTRQSSGASAPLLPVRRWPRSGRARAGLSGARGQVPERGACTGTMSQRRAAAARPAREGLSPSATRPVRRGRSPERARGGGCGGMCPPKCAAEREARRRGQQPTEQPPEPGPDHSPEQRARSARCSLVRAEREGLSPSAERARLPRASGGLRPPGRRARACPRARPGRSAAAAARSAQPQGGTGGCAPRNGRRRREAPQRPQHRREERAQEPREEEPQRHRERPGERHQVPEQRPRSGRCLIFTHYVMCKYRPGAGAAAAKRPLLVLRRGGPVPRATLPGRRGAPVPRGTLPGLLDDFPDQLVRGQAAGQPSWVGVVARFGAVQLFQKYGWQLAVVPGVAVVRCV